MKRRNFRTTGLFLKCVFIFSFFLFPFALLPSAAAHRFHTTLTRIDYNANEKLYEISIRLFTHDLLPLLEQRSGGKRIDLEKTFGVDEMIQNYLNENFVLTDKKGAVKHLKWIGKEIETDSIRIFVETPATENLEGYKLKNTLFFECFPEQSNLVVCRYDGKKADLMFKVGDKIKEITENKSAEK
jgi:hypothetical protein